MVESPAGIETLFNFKTGIQGMGLVDFMCVEVFFLSCPIAAAAVVCERYQ